MSRLALAALATVAFSFTASAATLRVCASGCTYTKLQSAIDAAQPGDTILLRAGETFVGNYTLRDKGSSTAFITKPGEVLPLEVYLEMMKAEAQTQYIAGRPIGRQLRLPV